MRVQAELIRAIIFDLDGTLYVSDAFAVLIQAAAQEYIARVKGITPEQAGEQMKLARNRLEEQYGRRQTLSAICVELGGDVQSLHAFFVEQLHPEACLARDERVVTLLNQLAHKYQLYVFTNNNRSLTTRIIASLGLDGIFRKIYTIDDSWKGKPDDELLDHVLTDTAMTPSEALFVGDRYDIDLRLPELRGCPVYLSQSIEQLLRLETLLNLKKQLTTKSTK